MGFQVEERDKEKEKERQRGKDRRGERRQTLSSKRQSQKLGICGSQKWKELRQGVLGNHV